MPRLLGPATYADGKPFTGVLRLRCMSSNSLMQTWRNLRVLVGEIEDVTLHPGLYEVQWLDAAPEGFVPSEEWLVPDEERVDVKALRSRWAAPLVVEKKDEVIRALQNEVERLRAELEETKQNPVR